MTIAYFDLISGAAGDMLLGALLDAGLPEKDLVSELEKLSLDDFHLSTKKVLKNCFSATKVEVHVHDHAPERHLADLQKVVNDSSLSDSVKERANRIFRRICEAEAAIHNESVDSVHLHEVGGVDAIVDVCGVLAGLERLGVDQIIVSPFPLGRGFVVGAHGQIPLPAPATAALLKGCPVVGSQIDRELVTPTGAALLTELADGYGPIPAMALESIGYGAGTADFETPNVVRILLGQGTNGSQQGTSNMITENLVEIESNLDDESPEILGHLSQTLLKAGALDVALLPVQMKKNRPGVQVQILAKPADADTLQTLLLSETTTLGVKRREIRRDSLPRRFETVTTEYGPIQVKVATLANGPAKIIPEYEDCRKAAEKSGKPLRDIFHDVQHKAAHQLHLPHSHGHDHGHSHDHEH